jgi:hypothetical protein
MVHLMEEVTIVNIRVGIGAQKDAAPPSGEVGVLLRASGLENELGCPGKILHNMPNPAVVVIVDTKQLRLELGAHPVSNVVGVREEEKVFHAGWARASVSRC